MRKRGKVVLVLILFIIAFCLPLALAEDGPSEGGGEEQKRTEIPLPPGYDTAPGSTVTPQGDNYQIQGGLSTPEGTVRGNLLVDTQGRILQATDYTLPNGAKGTNAENIELKDKDKYRMTRVGTLDQGPIVLTNAQDVRWDNGVMTAASAGSMDYKGSTSNDIIRLVADGKKFSVGSASAVQAGCFLVEEVDNAEFVVGQTMLMTTSGAGKVVYDQGSKVDYSAKELNSTLAGSITACRRPTYQVRAMELNTKTGLATELVNGSGEIQLDGRYGVVCINLTPVSTYDFDTGKYEDSFGFVIKDYAYKLCIQKAVSQQLVSDCPMCGLVDLASQKLLLNGVIEYTRYLFDSALIDANKRTAFRATGFGKNAIDLKKGEIIIQQDAPEFQTKPGNYLELLETNTGAGTHRLLGINEKLGRISQNWARSYAAAYSDSRTTIVDNLLDYQRGSCHVAVLPPDSSQAAAVLSSLKAQEARYP